MKVIERYIFRRAFDAVLRIAGLDAGDRLDDAGAGANQPRDRQRPVGAGLLRDRDADPAVDHSGRRAFRLRHRRGADADDDEHRFGTGGDQRGRQLAHGDHPADHAAGRAASIFSFAVDNGVDPYARQRGRELVAAARGDLLSLVIQEGTFRKIDDGLFIQIGERLPDGKLGGIFVADSRTEGIDLVYYAKTGAVVRAATARTC